MNTKLTISISILTQLLFAGLKTAAITHTTALTISKSVQKAPLIAQPLTNTSETLLLQKLIFTTFNP